MKSESRPKPGSPAPKRAPQRESRVDPAHSVAKVRVGPGSGVGTGVGLGVGSGVGSGGGGGVGSSVGAGGAFVGVGGGAGTCVGRSVGAAVGAAVAAGGSGGADGSARTVTITDARMREGALALVPGTRGVLPPPLPFDMTAGPCSLGWLFAVTVTVVSNVPAPEVRTEGMEAADPS